MSKKVHTYSPIALHDGDVIVVMGSDLLSRLIAKLTRRGTGDWSHVGMVVTYEGHQYVQEALKKGVVCTEINDYFKRYKKWAILRCNNLFNAESLNMRSFTYIGCPYAFKQIWKDLIAIWIKGFRGRQVYKKLKRDCDYGVTCPEWIGYVYDWVSAGEIKIQEITNSYWVSPNYLAPNDFIDSPNFDILADSHEKYGKVIQKD